MIESLRYAILFAATIGLFGAMVLTLVRLYLGPNIYDRILAGNAFGAQTVLCIGLVGFLMGRPDFLDIALLYALINFVGTIAFLKFFRYKVIGDLKAQDHGDST